METTSTLAPAARTARTALAGLLRDELDARVVGLGLPKSHAERIVKACLRRGAASFAQVEALGAKAVLALDASLAVRTTRVAGRNASLDGTTKLLVETEDGERVESVLMPLSKRWSGCVSSQVGCGAACSFCASGLEGLKRSLRPAEIVEQVLHLVDEARSRGRRLDNLVFMGMGEPFHAYDTVVRAIRVLTDPRLLGFGPSRITVSTVGVVPGILALAEEGLGVHLAVSLHAADDALRRSLLPVGGKYGVAETLDAADRYRLRTGRFVTVQVTLMAGVNDADEHALSLVRAVAGRPFHVNLIPVNRVEGTPYEPPTQERLDQFLATCRAGGLIAHVRARRGSDVDAACGQLRRRSPGTIGETHPEVVA